MTTPPSDIEAFLGALEPGEHPLFRAQSIQLATHLEDVWLKARTDFPNVIISGYDFWCHVARKVSRLRLSPDDFFGVFIMDIFLAYAGGRGDQAAIQSIEKSCFPHVEAALARMPGAAGLASDVKQVLRWEFFVPQSVVPAALDAYDGLGPLRSWLATAAVRTATRMMRPRQRELPNEDVLMNASAGVDMQSEHMRHVDAAAFKRIVSEATLALLARDRLLLCQHYVDDMTIDQLAALHDIHRATAARWVDKARQALRQQILTLLDRNLAVTGQARDSLVRYMMSDLNLTLSSLRKP